MWSSYAMKATQLPTIPEPPAISLIITDRNQMDSGSHADYWVRKFYISRVWMPTKSKPSQANQRVSSLIRASVKGSVALFVPSTVRRQWLLWLSLAPSWGIQICSTTLRKSAHHLYIKNMVAGGGCLCKKSKTTWLITKPAMMSAWINVSHRHANQLHDIITASITPVGLQSYSKDNMAQHLKPQETSTVLSDVL